MTCRPPRCAALLPSRPPQTLEAISHARAAGCPLVVAITKCDMPMADPQRVRQQLIGRGLELEEVGGSVQVRAGGGPGAGLGVGGLCAVVVGGAPGTVAGYGAGRGRRGLRLACSVGCMV